MPELSFHVRGAQPLRTTAVPAVALHLDVLATPPAQPIETAILNCQIQIEASRRRYASAEKERLRDLFGEPERWRDTLKPMLWTNLTATVPAFMESIGIQLTVPCTFDFNVAATKYFHGVEGAGIPLTLLFSGTVFYRTAAGALQAAPIPWNTESRFLLPVEVWKEAIDLQHRNTAWIELRRDCFEQLYELKVRAGLATLNDAVEALMQQTAAKAEA